MKITEKSLRSLIRDLLSESTEKYRMGKDSKLWAAGDSDNIPKVDGVNVDVCRANDDVHNPMYSVKIEVENHPELNVQLTTFKDESEAKVYARNKMDSIRTALQNLKT